MEQHHALVWGSDYFPPLGIDNVTYGQFKSNFRLLSADKLDLVQWRATELVRNLGANGIWGKGKGNWVRMTQKQKCQKQRNCSLLLPNVGADGAYRKEGARFFSEMQSKRTRGNSRCLQQRIFWLSLNLCTIKVVKHKYRLPPETVATLYMETYKTWWYTALSSLM